MANHKINLAPEAEAFVSSNVNITTTYAGEFSGKYISAALLNASTINDGGVTVMPNVKFKSVIQKVATGSLMTAASCNFQDNTSLTLTERIIQPSELQVNFELCKKDFVDTWESIQMGYSAFDVLPKSFADYLIAHLAAKIAQENEINLWQGCPAGTVPGSVYQGFIDRFEADGDVLKVSGVTSTSLSKANIISEFEKVVDLIPSTLYGKEDLYLYVGNAAAKYYIQALGGFQASGVGAAGIDNQGTMWYNNGTLSFGGVKIFVCPGLPNNTLVAAQKSNLYFGTGLLNDYNQVKVIDMADIDGSKNVRMVMRFTAGTQHGIGSEIVLYQGQGAEIDCLGGMS